MRVGISVPQVGRLAEVAAVREVARAAEANGYDSLWAVDAVFAAPTAIAGVLDPIGTLHVAAAETERVRIGTSVLVGPWYPPVLLARSLTTLEHASAGRLTVGLGVGWPESPYGAVGVPPRHQAARLEELLDVLDAVWGDDPVSHTGARLQFGPVDVRPKPRQRPRPPLLLAARTPSGLDRIARRGDGWTVGGLGVDTVGSMWRALRELTAGYGRDPDGLQLVVRVDALVTERALGRDRESYCGSLAQIGDDLDATRGLGAHEVIVGLRREPASPAELLDGYAELAELLPTAGIAG